MLVVLKSPESGLLSAVVPSRHDKNSISWNPRSRSAAVREAGNTAFVRMLVYVQVQGNGCTRCLFSRHCVNLGVVAEEREPKKKATKTENKTKQKMQSAKIIWLACGLPQSIKLIRDISFTNYHYIGWVGGGAQREREIWSDLFISRQWRYSTKANWPAVARVLLLTRTFIMDVTRNMTACKGVKPTDY